MSIHSRWLGSIREECTTDYKVLILRRQWVRKKYLHKWKRIACFVSKNVIFFKRSFREMCYFPKVRSEKCINLKKIVPKHVDIRLRW